MQVEMKPDFFSVDLEGRPAQAYNESAFRYFLSSELKRSERSGRTFVLVLVEPRVQHGAASIDPDIANRLFSGLSLCLRETDFIGWYEDGVVAGAVLTHLGESAGPDIVQLVHRRITNVVFAGLFPELADRFALRVHQLPAQEDVLGENRN